MRVGFRNPSLCMWKGLCMFFMCVHIVDASGPRYWLQSVRITEERGGSFCSCKYAPKMKREKAIAEEMETVSSDRQGLKWGATTRDVSCFPNSVAGSSEGHSPQRCVLQRTWKPRWDGRSTLIAVVVSRKTCCCTQMNNIPLCSCSSIRPPQLVKVCKGSPAASVFILMVLVCIIHDLFFMFP